MSYANAYPIFDYINVGMVHNDTIASRVSAAQLFQLQTLADLQQWALNGNITSVKNPGVLPIGGRTFATKITTQLSSIIDSKGTKNKFSLLVGSYDTFLSFFALSQLPSANSNFFGLPGYAGTMAFELISYSSDSAFPKDTKDLYVRFLFRNGTDSTSPLSEYPLFGRSHDNAVMPWADFQDAMASISVSSLSEWCTLCNATESFCPLESSSTNANTASANNSKKSQPLSPAVAGVVGAICALAAVALVAVLAMVAFGMRFAKPKKAASQNGFGAGEKVDNASSVGGSSVHHPNKI